MSLDGILSEDYLVLKSGFCPDCNKAIAHYFITSDRPWCKYCDVYFTFEPGSGWIIRNTNAKEQYDKGAATSTGT
jgi:hypothetical protein